MKKIFLAALILIFIFISCAYYNVFYNAKYYFNKGYKATQNNNSDKITTEERNNYQKAIDKSEKLIRLYPKSKYVDDALILLGKSYYYLGDMYRAKNNFNLLKENFPESKFLNEVIIWLARIAIYEKKYDIAETSLKNLKYGKLTKELMADVHSSLGRLYLNTKRFNDAVKEYTGALKYAEKDKKSGYYFTIAACYDSLQQYKEAKKYCEKSLKTANSRPERFNARFAIGELEKKLGNYDSAIKIFEKLLLDESNKLRAGRINIKIAECLELKGDVDGAIITLEDITQEFKRKKESAEAYYKLGKIFEKEKRDYEKAVFNYGKVKKEYSFSPFADSAEVRKRDILRMQALKQVIRMAVTGESGEGVSVDFENSTEEDSLSTVSGDSVNTGNKGKSSDLISGQQNNLQNRTNTENERSNLPVDRAQRNLLEQSEISTDKKKEKKPVENPELSNFKKEELDKNLYLLGEIYFTRFALMDSAINMFRNLIENFPESNYSPKALYVLSYILSEVYKDTANADTCYRRIINKYPKSDYANYARTKLGIAPVATRIDSAEAIFLEAEKCLFDKNDPENAYNLYNKIFKKFPDTDFAAKALFIRGWICETVWDSLDLAAAVYDTLIVNYPETEYATSVKVKLDEYKRGKEQEAKQKDQIVKAPEDSVNTGVENKDDLFKNKSEKPENDKQKITKEKTEIKQPVKKKEIDIKAQLNSEKNEAGNSKVVNNLQNKDAEIKGGISALKNNISIPEMLMNSVPRVIVVQIYINEKGKAEKVELASKQENETLLAVIRAAVRKTEFKPSLIAGKPIASWLTVRIPLKLTESE